MRTVKALREQHRKSRECIDEMKAMKARQNCIILNALQFINDVVDNPDLKQVSHFDSGFVCKLNKEEIARPDY